METVPREKNWTPLPTASVWSRKAWDRDRVHAWIQVWQIATLLASAMMDRPREVSPDFLVLRLPDLPGFAVNCVDAFDSTLTGRVRRVGRRKGLRARPEVSEEYCWCFAPPHPGPLPKGEGETLAPRAVP